MKMCRQQEAKEEAKGKWAAMIGITTCSTGGAKLSDRCKMKVKMINLCFYYVTSFCSCSLIVFSILMHIMRRGCLSSFLFLSYVSLEIPLKHFLWHWAVQINSTHKEGGISNTGMAKLTCRRGCLGVLYNTCMKAVRCISLCWEL